MIDVFILQDGFCALDVARGGLDLDEGNLSLVAHQEIDLQPGLLVIVVQVPAHLGENVCDDVLKDGTLVTEKVSLQDIRLCALL